jgi:hypothetical protein
MNVDKVLREIAFFTIRKEIREILFYHLEH